MRVTIITPTIRKEGLDVVRKSLLKQTHKDWEWLIGSKFDPEIPEARWIKDDFEGGYWTLNRIYNKLFSESTSKLIISWQDWIYANHEGLEKFIANYEATKGVISGVGDQYESIDKWGKPQIKIWADPRKTEKYGSFYECMPNDAEWNWCAIPTDEIFKAGGMDEGLDFIGYGGDQLQLSQRMDELGCKFYLDQTNESYTVRHDRSSFGGQEEWDANHVLFNGTYDARVLELKTKGTWPVLPYLQAKE